MSRPALLSALAASVAAAALLPATAGADSSHTIALQAPAQGVALDGAGLIERATQTDAIFNADGTLDQRVDLPGADGTAGNAVTAADGSVWVAIGTPDDTGGLARVTSDGTVTSVPTGALSSCGPAGLAAAGSDIAFTPATGTGCPDGGVGTVTGTTPSMLTTTEPGGHGLVHADGSLFVSDYDHDEIHRLNSDGTVAATIDVPAGSGPDQLVLGSDDKIYVTLSKTADIVRFDPGAPTGTQAEHFPLDSHAGIGGLSAPGGMAIGPYGDVYLADRGGAWIIAPGGDTHWRQTSFDAMPGQIARAGHDLWVTDPQAARVAVLDDDEPEIVIGSFSSADQHATAYVDAHGNNTDVWFTATKDGQTRSSTHNLLGDSGPGGVAGGTFYPALAPGDWVLTGHAANRRATVDSASVTLHIGDPGQPAQENQTPSQTPVPRPSQDQGTTTLDAPPMTLTAPVAPRFAELVQVASTTRCVSGRHVLLLRLHKQPTARTIAWVSVKVGKGKARKYQARALKHGLQLRGLPAHGKYQVAVSVRLANGKSYVKALTYRACA
jgi:hypothetical protein